MKSNPLVSVNVRTYNSAKTLNETLQSVRNQSYHKIELIISDGHSKDDSLKIAKNYKAKIGFSDNLGDARFQNYKNSKGKYIISLDSDQLMDKDLIKECVRVCENNKADALIIAEKSISNKGTYLEKVLAYDKWLIDQSRDINVVFGTACPRFFRRDLLMGVRWPKGIGIFDDTILYAQLSKNGAKIAYISKQAIRHKEVSSLIILIKKFFRYGKSYFNAFQENPATIAAHSLPRKSYFSKAAIKKPSLFPGLIFLYLVKAFAAGAGALYFFTEKAIKKETNRG